MIIFMVVSSGSLANPMSMCWSSIWPLMDKNRDNSIFGRAAMPAIYGSGKQIDHYQITCSLGQGVTSRVYLAQDLATQQKVVLKFPIDDIIGGAAIFERYQ